jgi:hypothetical protein
MGEGGRKGCLDSMGKVERSVLPVCPFFHYQLQAEMTGSSRADLTSSLRLLRIDPSSDYSMMTENFSFRMLTDDINTSRIIEEISEEGSSISKVSKQLELAPNDRSDDENDSLASPFRPNQKRPFVKGRVDLSSASERERCFYSFFGFGRDPQLILLARSSSSAEDASPVTRKIAALRKTSNEKDLSPNTRRVIRLRKMDIEDTIGKGYPYTSPRPDYRKRYVNVQATPSDDERTSSLSHFSEREEEEEDEFDLEGDQGGRDVTTSSFGEGVVARGKRSRTELEKESEKKRNVKGKGRMQMLDEEESFGSGSGSSEYESQSGSGESEDEDEDEEEEEEEEAEKSEEEGSFVSSQAYTGTLELSLSPFYQHRSWFRGHLC